MHTDETLEILERVSARLGSQLRTFANETCPSFSTQELRHEADSRKRRQAREGKNGRAQTRGTSAIATGDRHPKVLNLRTYKLHALGDYPAQIRKYGTTDSYSTQSVSCVGVILTLLINYLQGELEHRTSKRRFMRTSHKAFIPQLAAIERRQARIRRIRMRQEVLNATDPTPKALEHHHAIGKSQNDPQDINKFLQDNSDDPAAKVAPLSSLITTKLTAQNLIGLSSKA